MSLSKPCGGGVVTGPAWGELWAHMGWPRHSCSARFRMQKLRKHGLVWEEDVHRSLDVTPAGKERVRDWHAAREAS